MEGAGQAEKDPERVYDQKYANLWRNVIYGTPHSSGCGLFKYESEEQTDPSGFKYTYGIPEDKDDVLEAHRLRNEKMLKLTLENLPADRKVKALELGSGRGSLARYLAVELIKVDKLECYTSYNISPYENEHNLAEAKKLSIPEDKFKVEKKSFDDMADVPDGSYDLILSNDALYHTRDPKKLMEEVARIVSPGGLVHISDLLETAEADRKKTAELYGYYDCFDMGTAKLYDETLRANGCTKIHYDTDGGRDIRLNHGLKLYNATGPKKELLLGGPDGMPPEYLEYRLKIARCWVSLARDGHIEVGWFVYRK